MYLVLGCMVIIVALWFLQGQRSSIRRHGKRIPRPPGTLPLAGNGIWFLQPRHKLLDWFSQCERQSGLSTFEISVPSLPPAIVINDPSNVEHVLKNHELFIKGHFFRARSWDLFGDGIINADGDLWKLQRKAGVRFFSASNLKTFIDEVWPRHLKNAENRLEAATGGSKVVDLQEVFLELTTGLMGEMAYDMDIPASLPFSNAFDFASGAIAERFQNPFWKLKELVFGSQLRNAITEVKRFGASIVAEAIKRRACFVGPKKGSAATVNPPRNNLVDSLLDHINDHQIVADAAMNYLSAGRDTTAQSLTWTFYLLMRHPACLEEIRNELHKAFPKNGPHLPLTFDSLQPLHLPYTNAVFNESLRLYPPVPIEIKECNSPNVFPDGTFLPKSALVMWIPWAMGRSKRLWGDDADSFRPDRWLSKNARGKADLITKTAFEFPVFNGGARSCLGKKMAEALAIGAITSLAWKFDFEEILDERLGSSGVARERISQNSLTLPMNGGSPCVVRRRKDLFATEGSMQNVVQSEREVEP